MEPPLAPADAFPPDARTTPNLDPVLLLSSYRTGSTWLWQKLRGAPGTLAYYEIFNECLAHLKAEDVRSTDYAAWDSRHPVSTAYFTEFLPFLARGGGAIGFEPSMSFDSFIPLGGPDGDLRSAEASYVDRLVAAARASRRVPVLSCTRSLGRARALRRAIGGRAILLHRNMFQQWASYCSLAQGGNRSFLESVVKTVRGSAHDPFLRNVADWFRLRDAAPEGQELFQLFVIVHLYLYGIAFDAADLVVDLNELARNRSVRNQVEQAIGAMIAGDVDLSDATEQCEFADVTIASPQRTRDTIEQFAKLIPPETTSRQAMDFIQRMKADALAEWERFEFFNRRTRVFYLGKLAEASRQLDEQRSRVASLQEENNRLADALAQAAAPTAS